MHLLDLISEWAKDQGEAEDSGSGLSRTITVTIQDREYLFFSKPTVTWARPSLRSIQDKEAVFEVGEDSILILKHRFHQPMETCHAGHPNLFGWLKYYMGGKQ